MKIYGVRGQIRGAGNETLARLAGEGGERERAG